jgi:hypothetical protein
MDARRGIKKLELTAWEDLTRKHRDGRYTVTIRPGQRAMRCYLARKRRRERVVLVFAELRLVSTARGLSLPPTRSSPCASNSAT